MHDGQQYELREQYDASALPASEAGVSVVRSEAQARAILGAALGRGMHVGGSTPPGYETWGSDAPADTHGYVARLLEDLRLRRRTLVALETHRPMDSAGHIDDRIVDLADLAGPEDNDNWVEFVFEYPDGTKVSGIDYVLVHPANNEEPGKLQRNGTISKRGIAPGQYTVVIKEVERAVWKRERASCVEDLEIIGRVSGYPDGTPAKVKLYRERMESAGAELATVDATVEDGAIVTQLRYDYMADETTQRETGVIGLIAEISVDGGKSWAKTTRPLALQLKTMRGVTWSTERADAGDVVDIVVEAAGYPAGTQVALELWRLDRIAGDSKICDVGPVPLEGERASARCAYASSEAADATIDGAGEYYVVAKIEDDVTRMARSRVIWCAYDLAALEDASAA